MVAEGVASARTLAKEEAADLREIAALMHAKARRMLGANPSSAIGRALAAYATIYDLKADALEAEAEALS